MTVTPSGPHPFDTSAGGPASRTGAPGEESERASPAAGDRSIQLAWDMSGGTAADVRGVYTPPQSSPKLPEGETAGKEALKYLLSRVPLSVPAAAATWPVGLALNEYLARNARGDNPFGMTAFPVIETAGGADGARLRPPLSLTGDYRPASLSNLQLVPPGSKGAPWPKAAGDDDGKPIVLPPPHFEPKYDKDDPRQVAVMEELWTGAIDGNEAQNRINAIRRGEGASGPRGPWSNPPGAVEAAGISPPPRQRPWYIPDEIKIRFGSPDQSEERIFVEKADDLRKIFEHISTRLGQEPLMVPGHGGFFFLKENGLVLSDGHFVPDPEGQAGGWVRWSATADKYSPDGQQLNITYKDGNTFKSTRIYVERPWFLPEGMQFQETPGAGTARRILVNKIGDLTDIMYHLTKEPGTSHTLVRPSGVDLSSGRLTWEPVSGFPAASGVYGTDVTFPNGSAKWRNTGDPITKDGPYIEIKDDKGITRIHVKGWERLSPYRTWLWWSNVKY